VQVPAPHDPSITLGKAILQANDLDHPTWWMGASIGILIAYIVVVNVVLNLALRMLPGALTCPLNFPLPLSRRPLHAPAAWGKRSVCTLHACVLCSS
jgi:hypothetical protein